MRSPIAGRKAAPRKKIVLAAASYAKPLVVLRGTTVVIVLPARVMPTFRLAEIGVSARTNWLAAPDTASTISVSTVPGLASHVR